MQPSPTSREPSARQVLVSLLPPLPFLNWPRDLDDCEEPLNGIKHKSVLCFWIFPPKQKVYIHPELTGKICPSVEYRNLALNNNLGTISKNNLAYSYNGLKREFSV